MVKSVLQGISGLPHVVYRPALSTVSQVYNVAGRADQVVPDGECLFRFDTAEGGGLLQMFFAADAFFRTLKASLCFLVLFWLMWLLSSFFFFFFWSASAFFSDCCNSVHPR